GGFLAQHLPEPGAHVRRHGEQQRRAVGARRLRHKGRELVLARGAPSLIFGDQQSTQPVAVQMKVRRNGEGRPHEAEAMTRSSLVNATSKVACSCRRHESVSVVAKSPFSKNLLPGGPPPQYGA